MDSHITRDHNGKTLCHIVSPFAHDPDTLETVAHAVRSFGFLIIHNETLTAAEFADRIAQHYDCDTNPQNRTAVEVLRSLL
jgi:hypothetical protein